MLKPPKDKDVDPEKFIIGEGLYSNLRIAVPCNDAGEFRIDPSPMPMALMAVTNAVFVVFFGAFYWICSAYSNASETLVTLAAVGIGAMTSILFTVSVYYSFDKARRLGPWLVINKNTQKVSLPREGLEFAAGEIVHLQYITTTHIDGPGSLDGPLSELNLVTFANGERARWPLLRSSDNVRAFEYITEPLSECTDLPIVRIVEKQFGGKITETQLINNNAVNRSDEVERV